MRNQSQRLLVITSIFISMAGLGCELGNPQDYEHNTESGELELSQSASRQAECDDEVTQGYIDTIEALSNWSFGEIDKTHPDYCKIVEETLDALDKYLEDAPFLVEAKIIIKIKNTKGIYKGLSVAAFTQGNSDGSHTITHYNPNAATSVIIPVQSSGGGPLAANMGSAKADKAKEVKKGDPPTKDEIEITVHHEFGHVYWNQLGAEDKELWNELAALLIDLGLQPNQPYSGGNYFEVVEKNGDHMEGFCVAWSFVQSGQPVDSSITAFFDGLKNQD
ncbi:MAG TPA: hypothetical protein EYN06_05780 [Myxococcales bacterium]|nr:hypothetical protein [Myxococcales bacterium]HIN85973.1 hypothetical protein [Myxococcales bacterium]